MKKKLTVQEYVVVASMLFGLFFGAGNLIFPVHMGQMAGSQLVPWALEKVHDHPDGAMCAPCCPKWRPLATSAT